MPLSRREQTRPISADSPWPRHILRTKRQQRRTTRSRDLQMYGVVTSRRRRHVKIRKGIRHRLLRNYEYHTRKVLGWNEEGTEYHLNRFGVDKDLPDLWWIRKRRDAWQSQTLNSMRITRCSNYCKYLWRVCSKRFRSVFGKCSQHQELDT